jgi:tetratricopeptide (TPR) repeat protein
LALSSRRCLLAALVVATCVSVISCNDSSSIGNPTAIHLGKHPAAGTGQFDAFLAAADAAEANTDKLARCLAYPDPPLSHWSHATVVAYCQYLFQPVISISEMQDLIGHGHAKELDRRLSQVLRTQASQTHGAGLIDTIYSQDIYSHSDDAPDSLRSMLDSWKRQSPNSAFAWAASGDAYVAAAARARGGDYTEETPQHKIDAMDKLVGQARSDLEKAVSIEPKLTPAYVGMIDLGGYDLGTAYALDAGRRGLEVDPSNYAIHDELRWVAQPQWGGSFEAMQKVVSQAQAHARDNPLLLLLRAEPPALAMGLDECGCHAGNVVDFASVFEQPARRGLLVGAGRYFTSRHSYGPAAIYYAEAARFGRSSPEDVHDRIEGLVQIHQLKFALGLANRHLAENPKDEHLLTMRAEVYSHMHDSAGVEKDLLQILSFTKDDLWALTSLAHQYVENTHEWDKAWAITDRLIKEYPAKSEGWLLRGEIQANQPRPGLQETVDYYQVHFGSDPDEQDNINQMKYWLAHPRK